MALSLNGTSGISGVDGSAGTPALQGSDTNTGISFGTDTVNINTGGTTRATVDSSGRVLVGTSTSPSAGEGQYANFVAQGYTGNSTGGSNIALQRGSAASSILTGYDLGTVSFNDNSGNTFGFIRCVADGTAGTNDYPGRLVFSTTADSASSPTERMRLNNTGQLYTQSTGSGNFFSTTQGAGTTYTTIQAGHTSTAISAFTTSFQVFSNGNTQNTNNSYAGISDAKLKENIVDATSQWSDIKALQVRKYNFKPETNQESHTQIGLVAQEVELVSPGLVSESPDRDAEGNDLGTVTKSVNYSVLYMKAVKALQEAMERIETLETRLTALEGGTNP